MFRIAKVEIPSITYLETEMIMENAVLKNMEIKSLDVLTVINLARGWNYLYESLDSELNCELVLKIHDIVANHQALESGNVRGVDVSISGTTNIPPSPYTQDLSKMFSDRLQRLVDESQNYPIEAAICYLLDACRNQYFWDGNKRTAFFVANLVLLQTGNGVLGLDDNTISDFSRRFTSFYETSDMQDIAEFMSEKCLVTFGFQLSNEFNKSFFER